MTYVFDTNSFRVLGNYYPERFPSFWEQFDEAVRAGMVASVREVRHELEVQAVSQSLLDWVARNKGIFVVPGPDEMAFIAEIFRVPHFQALVGERQRLQGSPVADPFIIASARRRGGCVVTEEQHKPNAAKIPNVCDHFGIEWTNVEGFLTRERWSF